MTNKDLQKLLSTYPDDAEIVHTYTDPLGNDYETDIEPCYNQISKKLYL